MKIKEKRGGNLFFEYSFKFQFHSTDLRPVSYTHLLPGIGSAYAGKLMQGIVIFIIALILIALQLVIGWIAYVLYIIVWAYGLYDAYTTAKAAEA